MTNATDQSATRAMQIDAHAAVPDYQTLMRPVLQAFADGATNVRDLLPDLARDLNLSQEAVDARIPSGQETVLSNRAHWARSYLSKAGYLTSSKRNVHELTPKGAAALRAHPDRIENNTLSESKDFVTWRISGSKGQTPSNPPDASRDAASETPIEEMQSAFQAIERALASDVLEAVLSLTPAQFEKLVIDLLLAMGYGGGDLARGLQTRLSGDGGIDGIVNEDELGLDAVYIQAKRYDPDNKVGRPALNAFVGSLTGESATKGVFVTTSDFSRDALDYVSKVQQRIVLINGDRLARLMIKHEVGVRPRHAYVIRSIDEDYFSAV